MRRTTTPPRDEGFTLIEVVVAFALFITLVVASMVLLGSVQRATRDSSYRTTAINLAARELAITADTFNTIIRGPKQVEINEVVNPDQLAGGTPGGPLVVDNVPYTVKRTAQWVTVGSAAASVCDEGTDKELAQLRVHVEVTWPGGSDRPVEMNSVLTPLKGTYSVTQGHIGLKVIDRNGTPRANQVVTINGPSGTRSAKTSDDGCVLFAFLAPGSYTVTLDTTGYVDLAGNKTSTRSVTVQAGQLWRGTVSYDAAASITVGFKTADGYNLPQTNNLPLMFSTSAGTLERTGTGNSRAVTDLWPYPSGYEIWAGHCLDNDPAELDEAREPAVAADPAGTATAQVPLAPLTVTRSGGSVTVSATSKPSIENPKSPCAPMTVQLGSTANGQLKTSLPYGQWTIKAGSVTKDVLLTKAGGPMTVGL